MAEPFLPPTELCERCAVMPPTEVLIRSRTLLVDDSGTIYAEAEPRVYVCRQCWLAITAHNEPLPAPRILRHFEPPSA